MRKNFLKSNKTKILAGIIFLFSSFSAFAASSFAAALSSDESSEIKDSAQNYGVLASNEESKEESAMMDDYYNQEMKDADIKPLTPQKESIMEEVKTATLKVESNVARAEVYLNGVYKGTTPLVIEDLRPGRYRLEVRKRGYERAFYYIQLKKGQEAKYYIHLEKLKGYINFKNLPSGSQVFVDSSLKSENPVLVDVGSHTVRVKKFGYLTFTKSVTVIPFKTVNVDVKLEEAPFEISNFSVSKKKFNPAYAGSIGKVVFSFSVTANGTATAEIKDKSGNVIYAKHYPSFSTWEHSFEWNGQDDSGNIVPDGVYTCSLTSLCGTFTVETRVDSSLSYPLVNYTPGGLGYGNLPCALPGTPNLALVRLKCIPRMTFGQIFDVSGEFSISGIVAFADIFEFGGEAVLLPGVSDLSMEVRVNLSLKVSYSNNIGRGVSICYGGLVRYGFSSGSFFYPYGADNGCGLGAGLMLGLDTSMVYFGLSSQYLFFAGAGNFDEEDDMVWNNGFTLVFKPLRTLCVNVYGALNSDFGIYKYDSSKEVLGENQWFRAIDAGVGTVFMPGNSSIQINAGLSGLIFLTGTVYVSANMGMGILF